MNFKNLICTFLLCLSIIPVINACGCALTPQYFCQSANENHILARIRYISGGTNFSYVEVIETISNHTLPDTIGIIGDDGSNCAEGLPFFLGGDYLIALDSWEYNGETFYELNGCGRHFVRIPDNDTLSLDFDPCITSIAYADFIDDLQACLSRGKVTASGKISHWRSDLDNYGSHSFLINGIEIQTDEESNFDCISFGYDQLNLFDFGNTFTLIVDQIPNSDITFQITIKDFILIQKHLLDITPFEYSEQYLAADINNDQMISISDLVILRKAILGQITEFPNQDNWLYIENDCAFSEPDNPSLYECDYGYSNPISTTNYTPFLEFTAIKVGDVSGDL